MSIWVFAFWLQGAVLSWVFAGESKQHTTSQYVAGLTAFGLMLMLAGASAFGIGLAFGAGGGPAGGMGGVLTGVFLLGIGVLLHAPFTSRALGELVMAVADESTGRTGPPIKPTHDQAIAAMRAKDPVRAANLLNDAIEKDPGDVEARRLRAEVHHSCGETARAVSQLEAAYAVATDPGTKGSLGLRAAEIELGATPPGKTKARAWLARVRTDLAGTPFEGYAIERLRVIE